MNIEGAMIHGKCEGTGFVNIDDIDNIDVCVECMGSGVINVEIDIE